MQGNDAAGQFDRAVHERKQVDGCQPYLHDALVLEASADAGQLKVCLYEKTASGERTLRPYESFAVLWEQIEASRRDIITLLNRANRRARVSPDILESLEKSGQLLFDLLVPLKAKETIRTTHAGNLILYIDDKLVHLPWELLFDGSQFLCRRFAMGRIVRTRQAPNTFPSRTAKAPFKALVVSDPRGDLDASYREGVEIKNLLDEMSDIFHVDFKSHPVDVPFVKKNLRDYDIVHYAGHADYHADNPSESGWLLKDGRLKAGEISAMGGARPMPSLVFANACQSGHSGEWRVEDEYEQQIFGLANGYLLAGVQHYIGTFWEILDEPSCSFAKSFYRFLAQACPVGEAVRRARQELIKTYGEETIVWATYMLYGDPTFGFSAAMEDGPTEPFSANPKQVTWRPAMRGEQRATVSIVAEAKEPRYFYQALGAALLVLTFAAYLLFPHPGGEPTTASAVIGGPRHGLSTEVGQKLAPEAKREGQVVAEDRVAGERAEKLTGLKVAAKVNESLAAISPSPASRRLALDSALAAPLTLKMNIIGQRRESDGSYMETLVSEGSVLRSRDNFQVHLEVNGSAYVYILIYDSQGKAEQIFPDAKIHQPEFIEAGKKLVVPAQDLWFWLDENTGTETIYVLASEKPMADIKALLAKMENANDAGQRRASDEIKERIAAMQRGVGGITKGHAAGFTLSDGKRIQNVTEVITGAGSVVRAVSFHHK